MNWKEFNDIAGKNRPCVCYGVVYNTVKEASTALNINPQTLNSRIHSLVNKDCYYL